MKADNKSHIYNMKSFHKVLDVNSETAESVDYINFEYVLSDWRFVFYLK